MTDEKARRGNAYGDDPLHHAIRDGSFVCTAPPEAPCWTSPTCECENWCCCDGSPEDAAGNHDEGLHCCMTTTKPGAECWLVPWVHALGLEDSCGMDVWPEVRVWRETGWPDGAVTCDWEDGVLWHYWPTIPPGSTRP